MRTIQFRGKCLDGSWVYGNLCVLDKDRGHIKAGTYISNSAGTPFAYSVRPETVQQYTGYDYVQGQPVWEGDIWCKSGYGASTDVVVFDGGAFKLKNTRGGICVSEMNWLEFQVEKIGNVYDNPELLNN